MNERVHILSPDRAGLPDGWTARSHELRGYDSPDRWLSAEHVSGKRVTASTLDELREAVMRVQTEAPSVEIAHGDVRLESVTLTRCGDAYHLRVETKTKHFDISFGGGDGARSVFLEPEPMLDGERSTCITLLGLDGYTVTHRQGKSWLDVVLVRIREDAPVVWEWWAE